MDRARSEGEVNLGVVSITMDGREMLRNNVEEAGNVERGTPQFSFFSKGPGFSSTSMWTVKSFGQTKQVGPCLY